MHAISLRLLLSMLLGAYAFLGTSCGGKSSTNSPSTSNQNNPGVTPDELPKPTASAVTIVTVLSGAQEVPPVTSPAKGTAILAVDTSTGEITGTLFFSGLKAAATQAHIHAGVTGTTGPVLIPFSSGPYALGTAGVLTIPGRLKLSPEQLALLKADKLYINLHSSAHREGEIRGQMLHPQGDSPPRQ